MGDNGKTDPLIDEEDSDEAVIPIDEIINDSKSVRRCTTCRRQCYGHEGPTGEKCLMDKLIDDEEIKRDDEQKNKMREDSRTAKLTVVTDDDLEENIENEYLLSEKVINLKKQLEEVKKRKKKDKLRKEAKELRKLIEEENKTSVEKMKADENVRRTNREEKDEKSSSRSPRRGRNFKHGRSTTRSPKRRFQKSPSKGRRDRNNCSRRSPSRRERRKEGSRHSNHGRSPSRKGSGRSSSRKLSGRREESYQYRNRQRSPRFGEDRFDSQRNGDFMFQTLSRMQEEKLTPPPSWGKLSFQAWRSAVEDWNENRAKPVRKAQALIEMLKKDDEQKEHPGIREMVEVDIQEDLTFDKKQFSVVDKILAKVESFAEESAWKKTVKIEREVKSFLQKDGEKLDEYINRFNYMETKLRNEKINLPNKFLAAMLLNNSKLTQNEKENVLAKVELEDDKGDLIHIKKRLRDMKSMENESSKAFPVLFGSYNDRGRSRERFPGQRNSYRGKSMDRSSSRSHRDGKYRDRSSSRFHRDGKGRDHSTNKFHRDGKYRDRSSSRFHRDGKEKTPKRTYECKQLKLDNQKTIFENDIANLGIVDTGCPELVAGLPWLRTYESSIGKELEVVERKELFQFGDEVCEAKFFKRIPVEIGNEGSSRSWYCRN